MDRELIEAGTYYVAEVDGTLVGSGGWQAVPLRPQGPSCAAIRAIFVHPDWARRGIGRRLVAHAEAAAAQAGFGTFELEASLSGVPLYARLGYREIERYCLAMPDGATLPVVRMKKSAPFAPAARACR